MSRKCRVASCHGETKSRYGDFCGAHAERLRRHGHQLQRRILDTDLRHHREAVREFLDAQPGAWDTIKVLWDTLVTRAEGFTKAEKKAGYRIRHEGEAREDLAKVNAAAPLRDIVITIFAFWRARLYAPRLFASEEAFKVQLARMFRKFAPTHKGEMWVQSQGRSVRVYHEAGRRRLLCVFDLLLPLGAPALAAVQTMARREAAWEEAKRAASLALSQDYLNNGGESPLHHHKEEKEAA
jgi:transposase